MFKAFLLTCLVGRPKSLKFNSVLCINIHSFLNHKIIACRTLRQEGLNQLANNSRRANKVYGLRVLNNCQINPYLQLDLRDLFDVVICVAVAGCWRVYLYFFNFFRYLFIKYSHRKLMIVCQGRPVSSSELIKANKGYF